MNRKRAAILAGYLIRYHKNSHRIRQHELAEGSIRLSVTNELNNLRRRAGNDYDDVERLVQMQGFTSIILHNRERLAELRKKAEEADDATLLVDEISELYRQMQAADLLMKMLNG